MTTLIRESRETYGFVERNANPPGGTLMLIAGSLSFIGLGVMG